MEKIFEGLKKPWTCAGRYYRPLQNLATDQNGRLYQFVEVYVREDVAKFYGAMWTKPVVIDGARYWPEDIRAIPRGKSRFWAEQSETSWTSYGPAAEWSGEEKRGVELSILWNGEFIPAVDFYCHEMDIGF